MAAIFDLKAVEEFIAEKKKNGEYPQMYLLDHPELQELLKKYKTGKLQENTDEAKAAKMLQDEIEEYRNSPKKLIILEEYLKKEGKEEKMKEILKDVISASKRMGSKKYQTQLATYMASDSDRANKVRTILNPKKELDKIMAEPAQEPKPDVYELTEEELEERIKSFDSFAPGLGKEMVEDEYNMPLVEIRKIVKKISPKRNILAKGGAYLTSKLLGRDKKELDILRPLRRGEAKKIR